MKLNLKVRIKNKYFWLAAIPALLLVIKSVLILFGVDVDTEVVNSNLQQVVVAVFSFLSLLGVVNDPTTEGLSDSARAMTYDEPFGV